MSISSYSLFYIEVNLQGQANKNWDILHCAKWQQWYGVKTASIETVMYCSPFVQVV